jgi:DNA (cytosine-5)-methyltransferase 1
LGIANSRSSCQRPTADSGQGAGADYERRLKFEVQFGMPKNESVNHASSRTAIDLFAGGGGLTLGLTRAGFDVVAAVEVDDTAAVTYEKNHPSVRLRTRDIRKVPAAKVLRALRMKRGELDLLAGCPPCQGFSTIRTRNAHSKIEDERNDLIFDFLRFVRVFLPKAIMMENVPALAVDPRFSTFCTKLSLLGYSLKWDILDAADYGVPQRRKRLILVATLHSQPRLATPRPRRRTVRTAIGMLGRPTSSSDPLHNYRDDRSQRVRDLIRRIPRDGGSRSVLAQSEQLNCHRRLAGFHDVYGRMSWDDVAPTITGGCINPSKGRFLHPVQHRAITLREAALIQGFPPKYFFSLAKGKYRAAELIGNALPPQFIRAHAHELHRVLEETERESGGKRA